MRYRRIERGKGELWRGRGSLILLSILSTRSRQRRRPCLDVGEKTKEETLSGRWRCFFFFFFFARVGGDKAVYSIRRTSVYIIQKVREKGIPKL